MGTPELEDYLDGLDWLVANKQGDRDRAGIYGGSYGGFMAFMALFKQPGVFKAGAALRPVTDWSQYNHEYTVEHPQHAGARPGGLQACPRRSNTPTACRTTC